MMATVTYLPLYLQAVLQATPTEAGATLTCRLTFDPGEELRGSGVDIAKAQVVVERDECVADLLDA